MARKAIPQVCMKNGEISHHAVALFGKMKNTEVMYMKITFEKTAGASDCYWSGTPATLFPVQDY